MMNRRDLFKTVGAMSVGAAMPGSLFASEVPITGTNAVVKTELKRLMLRHTWTTTMSSSAYRDTVHLQYTRDGITGYGEGAPSGAGPDQQTITSQGNEYLQGHFPLLDFIKTATVE